MANPTSTLFLDLFAKNGIKTHRASLRNNGDYVVLVHGLLGGPFSMKKIEYYLNSYGFQVLNFKCSMKKYSIPAIADEFLHDFIKKHCLDKTKKIHFVTHSIGGILVRDYIQKYNSMVGRVVMLAPPNDGAQMYVSFAKIPGNEWILGVSGKQIANKKYLNILGDKVNFDLGVIAGNKSINPFSSIIFKRKNDGVVSVSSTKITGMKGHIVAPTSHYFMLFNDDVIRQILNFLSRGKFDK